MRKYIFSLPFSFRLDFRYFSIQFAPQVSTISVCCASRSFLSIFWSSFLPRVRPRQLLCWRRPRWFSTSDFCFISQWDNDVLINDALNSFFGGSSSPRNKMRSATLGSVRCRRRLASACSKWCARRCAGATGRRSWPATSPTKKPASLKILLIMLRRFLSNPLCPCQSAHFRNLKATFTVLS